MLVFLDGGVPKSYRKRRTTFRNPAITESVAVLNAVLEGLRRRGSYGGESLATETFEIKSFPEMTYGQGACMPTNEKIFLSPSSALSPRKIIHEGLHFASNWRFLENNRRVRKDRYKSGFSSVRAFDDLRVESTPDDEFRRLNEGFTEFFAGRLSVGLQDGTEDRRQEMILLCKKQFNEKIADDPAGSGLLEESSKMIAALSDAGAPPPYGSETAFVESYLFKKAMKRIRVLEQGTPRSVKDEMREAVVLEALDAFINGDTSFLSDVDEFFGKGAIQKVKTAKSSLDLIF